MNLFSCVILAFSLSYGFALRPGADTALPGVISMVMLEKKNLRTAPTEKASELSEVNGAIEEAKSEINEIEAEKEADEKKVAKEEKKLETAATPSESSSDTAQGESRAKAHAATALIGEQQQVLQRGGAEANASEINAALVDKAGDTQERGNLEAISAEDGTEAGGLLHEAVTLGEMATAEATEGARTAKVTGGEHVAKASAHF